MSFFGAFFVGLSLFAKGVSKGQDTYTDYKSKQRSKQIGQNFYYDSKGTCHDSETGRAITYYTDPFTGHRLIQDAYTLNTIRDLTAEERFKEIQKAKEKARIEGSEYYEIGRGKDALNRNEYLKLSHKYRWGMECLMGKRVKNRFGNYTKELQYSLDNIRFDNIGINYTFIYKKEGEGKRYIKEKVDTNLYYYSDLENGLAVEVDNMSKDRLKEMGISSIEFIDCINDRKRNYSMEHQGEIPISANL